MRVGLYKLTRPKRHAADWVWIVDHTLQVGREKVLAVVGLRLASWEPGSALRHQDMEPLALLPVRETTGAVVAAQLESTVATTGIPRLIVADHGSDVKLGIEMFCLAHRRTDYIYDIKHKTAIELKRMLSNDDSWNEFASRAAQSSAALRQTDLAALRPPNQRSKARYMNVGTLVSWGHRILRVLDRRTRAGQAAPVELGVSTSLLHDRLGWVREYREELDVWSELHQVAVVCEETVRDNGYTRSSGTALRSRLRGLVSTGPGRCLRRTMVEFVQIEAAKARPNERLVGSSEVLESVFGGFKNLERQQRHGGLTSFVLAIPALVGAMDATTVEAALANVSTSDVVNWAENAMGKTVHSKRRALLTTLQPERTDDGTKMDSGPRVPDP